MLLSLFFLSQYFANECLTNKDIRDYEWFAPYVAITIVCDWLMLIVGAAYELEWGGLAERYGRWGLAPGFLFLILAFLPHIDVLLHHPSRPALVLIALTIAIWSVYGMVSMFWLGRRRLKAKNAWFNILDLFSKNAFGVLVSVLLLADHDC